MGGPNSGLPVANSRPSQMRVNEPKLVPDRRFQDKRIEIGKVHRPYCRGDFRQVTHLKITIDLT